MLDDIFERHPQLRAAVQPPPLPRRDGSFHYTPAAVFAELEQRAAAGTYRLRAPAVSFDGLVAFRGTGTCLAPVLAGDYLFIDPQLQPTDGDFVIVHLDPEELAGIIERGRDDPEWLAMYGPNPGRNVTKLLHACGHEWYLQDKSTAFPLAGFRTARNNQVLGVVRKVMRGTGMLYEDAPAPAHCLQIGVNAATTVGETTVTNVTIGNPTVTVISQSVGPFVAAATVVITVSGYVTFQNTSGTVDVSPEFAYAIATSAATLPSGHPFDDVYSIPPSTTVGQSFTYEQTFSLAADTTQTYYFNAESVSTFNNVIVAKSLVLKAEAIYK